MTLIIINEDRKTIIADVIAIDKWSSLKDLFYPPTRKSAASLLSVLCTSIDKDELYSIAANYKSTRGETEHVSIHINAYSNSTINW